MATPPEGDETITEFDAFETRLSVPGSARERSVRPRVVWNSVVHTQERDTQETSFLEKGSRGFVFGGVVEARAPESNGIHDGRASRESR